MFLFKKKPKDSPFTFTFIFLCLFLSLAFFGANYFQNQKNQKYEQQIISLQKQIGSLQTKKEKNWENIINQSKLAIVTVFSFTNNENIDLNNVDTLFKQFSHQINAPIILGGGFIYDVQNAYIITAKHVASNKNGPFYIKFSPGNIALSHIIYQNDSISVLKIDDKTNLDFLTKIPISKQKPQLGQTLLFINNKTDNFTPAVQFGMINKTEITINEPVKLNNLYQLDLALDQGNSGLPIINNVGEAIGIIVGTVADKKSSFALSISDLTNLDFSNHRIN